jgi:hypothetical protein
VPFIKPGTINDIVGVGGVGTGIEYGDVGDHVIGAVKFVVYRKKYDDTDAPPSSIGGDHVTKTCWLSHVTEGVITGGPGVVEGVTSIILECEPTPTAFTAETRKSYIVPLVKGYGVGDDVGPIV